MICDLHYIIVKDCESLTSYTPLCSRHARNARLLTAMSVKLIQTLFTTPAHRNLAPNTNIHNLIVTTMPTFVGNEYTKKRAPPDSIFRTAYHNSDVAKGTNKKRKLNGALKHLSHPILSYRDTTSKQLGNI